MVERSIVPIPPVEGVADPAARRALIAIRANIDTLLGISGPSRMRALTRGDLIDLGLIGQDGRGSLFAKTLRDEQSRSEQDSKREYPDDAYTGQWLSATFDASGLSAGTFYIDSPTIPDASYVTNAWIEVTTALTGTGMLVGLGIETDDTTGIKTAALVGSAWTAGTHAAIQDGDPANFSTKTTGERRIRVNISGSGTITAGTFTLYFQVTTVPE